MELGETDILDPNPDIHALFCHYNSLYFADTLGACMVSWSSKRMTLCAGVCCYLRGGGCEIRLSEPLLKFRSSVDLKNTLLHEMIHAYLWITKKNRDRSDHGPGFQELMKGINSSLVADLQRPVGGYSITIYHAFHDEVDSYRVHHWMCQSCGDLIKRAVNREPSASDCIEKAIHDGFCGNPSCHWHGHKIICGGSYKKIAEPHGYVDKRMTRKGKRDIHGGMSKELTGATGKTAWKTSKTEGSKKESDVKKCNTMEKFYPVQRDAHNSTLASKSSPPEDLQNSNNSNGSNESQEKLSPPMPIHAPVVSRNYATRKRLKSSNVKRNELGEGQNDYTVIIKWKGWYAYEEDDEERIEPLRNKRMERRQNLLMNTECPSIKHNQNWIVSEDVTMDYTFHGGVPCERKSVTVGNNNGDRVSVISVEDTVADRSNTNGFQKGADLWGLQESLPTEHCIRDNKDDGRAYEACIHWSSGKLENSEYGQDTLPFDVSGGCINRICCRYFKDVEGSDFVDISDS